MEMSRNFTGWMDLEAGLTGSVETAKHREILQNFCIRLAEVTEKRPFIRKGKNSQLARGMGFRFSDFPAKACTARDDGLTGGP